MKHWSCADSSETAHDRAHSFRVYRPDVADFSSLLLSVFLLQRKILTSRFLYIKSYVQALMFCLLLSCFISGSLLDGVLFVGDDEK